MSQIRTLPTTSDMSSAFDVNSQQTDIETLVFSATSLEAVTKLMLSTEPRYVRVLNDHEVGAIHRFYRSIKKPVDHTAIRSAIYLGRTRENRRIGAPLSDEPCLYLIFSHMKDRRDTYVARLLEFVIIPNFEGALQAYQLSPVPGGARCANPPVFRENMDQMHGIMRPYEVRAHLNEDWTTTETSESAAASRQEIHGLAWQNMQKSIQDSADSRMQVFKDMELLILVPHVGHSVVSALNVRNSGGDITFALREALSLYEQDINPKFLEEGKVLYAGEFDLMKAEDHTMTTSGWRTFCIRDFFR
jgi:hypothetical protein